MGKGLAFLNLKFFHPGNKENQRRKWEALQRDAERQRKIKEREAELNQEKEIHETRKMLFEQELGSNSSEYRKELKKEQISWIYNAPPGLKKQIEKERAKVEEEKRLTEWQQAMESMSREERRFAEKEMENGLSVHERNVRRFEFLKNAPMVADYVKNMEVTHKPFGKLIRNVRCIKCGKWGHRIYDRECEMNNYNPYNKNRNTNNKSEKLKSEKNDENDMENNIKSEVINSDDDILKSEIIDNINNVEDNDNKSEVIENRHDPLYAMKSKFLSKHLERYNDGDDDMDLIDMKSTVTNKTYGGKSVFTLNPDGNDDVNARMFQVKNFGTNDGSKYELVGEVVNGDNKKRKKEKYKNKHKKDKKKKRKRDIDVDNDEDYKFIMSLDKDKQIKMLKEIEKREKKREKKSKKYKKKKHIDRKRNKRRHRSRTPSRSRSRSRSRHTKKRSYKRSRSR